MARTDSHTQVLGFTIKQEWCDIDAASWTIVERPDVKLFYDETAEPRPYWFMPVENNKVMSCVAVDFKTRLAALTALKNGDDIFCGYWKDVRGH